MGSRIAVLLYRTDDPEALAADLAARYGQEPPEEEDFTPQLIAAAKMTGMDDEGIKKLLQSWEQAKTETAKTKKRFNDMLKPEARQTISDMELPEIIQGDRFVALSIYDVIRCENVDDFAGKESRQVSCPVLAVSDYDDSFLSISLYQNGKLLMSGEHILYEDEGKVSLSGAKNVVSVDFSGKQAIPHVSNPIKLFQDVLGLTLTEEQITALFHSKESEDFDSTIQAITGIPFLDPDKLVLKERLTYGLWYQVSEY